MITHMTDVSQRLKLDEISAFGEVSQQIGTRNVKYCWKSWEIYWTRTRPQLYSTSLINSLSGYSERHEDGFSSTAQLHWPCALGCYTTYLRLVSTILIYRKVHDRLESQLCKFGRAEKCKMCPWMIQIKNELLTFKYSASIVLKALMIGQW